MHVKLCLLLSAAYGTRQHANCPRVQFQIKYIIYLHLGWRALRADSTQIIQLNSSCFRGPGEIGPRHGSVESEGRTKLQSEHKQEQFYHKLHILLSIIDFGQTNKVVYDFIKMNSRTSYLCIIWFQLIFIWFHLRITLRINDVTLKSFLLNCYWIDCTYQEIFVSWK